jgi:hypothetical protein
VFVARATHRSIAGDPFDFMQMHTKMFVLR